MSKMDKLFNRKNNKKANTQKALDIINKKNEKKVMKANIVPKSMKDKVDLAKIQSSEVYADKLHRLELVTDIERINEFFENVKKQGIIAVDTETNGLDRIDGKIAGICLYTPGEKSIYIPLGHYSYMTNNILKTNVDKSIIKEKLEECNKLGVKYILHNAKFDMHVIRHMIGVKIVPYWDTMIAGYLLNENEPHGLKVLYQKYIVNEDEDTKVASFNSLFNGIEFNKIPPEVAYMYASFDTIMTYELYLFQYEYLDKNGKYNKSKGLERVAEVFRNIEMPLIEVVFEMECTGVKIDIELAKRLKNEYEAYMIRAEKQFKEEIKKLHSQIKSLQKTDNAKYSNLVNSAGEIDINIASSQQLAILFYDVLGFISNDKRKPRGTGEEILKSFKHPVVTAILEYRAMSKLLTTYIEAIPEHISKRTGKLHANFNQYGAKTGRFSSSNPNLQNIPSKKKKLSDGTVIDAGHDIRQMFIAEEGYVLVGGDFSQQEPRCLAHVSNDENMLQAYRDNKDLYSTIASKIYGVPYEECKEFRPDGSVNEEGKQRRTSVKPILLGIMYGRGTASIAELLNISPKEAQGLINDFFKEFPKVKAFVDFAQSFARDYGFVQTIWGRKRRLVDMQLDPIEMKCKKGVNSANFNPLDFDADDSDDDYVSDEVYYKYLRLMNKAYGREAKDKIRQMAAEEGYEIIDNGGKIADAERQCVNSIIQGSAADMTKIAMNTIYRDEELRRLGYKLIIPVHDEVIGICPEENAKAAAERLEHIMIHIVDGIFTIQMKTDIEVTKRWYGENLKI
jgi:DNA polymerase I-like protein with 3'-5' exonuclease and polymerase domains